MIKIVIPVLLVSVVMIAGIFAFMPVDEAITVHTTVQASQLNNVEGTFQTALGANATASCTSGSFLVYFTLSNGTAPASPDTVANLNIANGSKLGSGSGAIDFTVVLAHANQTAVSGVLGAAAGTTLTFTGNPTGDVGDLSITVLCQSTATPILFP